MTQHRPGTFIVIEGTDGSGKATQFDLLCERLRQAGYKVATFDFPQYESPSSYFVKQYLNGEYGGVNEVGPYTASLFYALDRYEAGPRIRKALAEGKIVISNRFTGSSMGHQGTKFGSPEERRGFFIWLDNLEFEMLQIPRPDISFVLRVPADIAMALVDKKGKRGYTDKKRDIHEADLPHLEKSVEVYDDLTQLFPKDFQRIDCVRGDKLLDVDSIQKMLWEKITPLLPPPPQLEMPMKDTSSASATDVEAERPATSEPAKTAEDEDEQAAKAAEPAADDPQTPTDTAATPPRSKRFVIENASQLLAQRLEGNCPDAEEGDILPLTGDHTQKDANGNYRYFTPKNMSVLTTQKYHAAMGGIFDSYSEIATRLTQYLTENDSTPTDERDAAWQAAVRARALDASWLALPASAQTTVAVCTGGKALENLVVELLGDELPETRMIGEGLLRELPNLAPMLVKRKDLADRLNTALQYRIGTRNAVQKLAREYLPENHAGTSAAVQLTDIRPRNELELVPDMLYEHSSQPLAELRQNIAGWPYDRKLDVFEAYLGQRHTERLLPGPALTKVRYGWDILSPYGVFRELQHRRSIGRPACQPLTPRYGYDIPELVEAAGLTEQYERCFDLSLELYSTLQQAGHIQEAQYAVLLGHKLRWKFECDARKMSGLYDFVDATSACQQFLQLIHTLLAETHPLLAEALQATKPEALPAASIPSATMQKPY